MSHSLVLGILYMGTIFFIITYIKLLLFITFDFKLFESDKKNQIN